MMVELSLSLEIITKRMCYKRRKKKVCLESLNNFFCCCFSEEALDADRKVTIAIGHV